MAHATENVGGAPFTKEELNQLAKLLKHPKILKMVEETEDEEKAEK